MSQQIPFYNAEDSYDQRPYTEDVNYPRRLFMEWGFGFREIANTKGVLSDGSIVARIVEDYSPPTPSVNTAEVKLNNAPSIIHATGKASYKFSLRMIFPNRPIYNSFIFYCGNAIKFYDEKGAIYSGALADAPTVKRIDGGNRYDITAAFIAIKKESDDKVEQLGFNDVATDYWAYNHIMELAHIGIVTQFDRLGNHIFTFRPESITSRAESVVMMYRTLKWLERMFRG